MLLPTVFPYKVGKFVLRGFCMMGKLLNSVKRWGDDEATG